MKSLFSLFTRPRYYYDPRVRTVDNGGIIVYRVEIYKYKNGRAVYDRIDAARNPLKLLERVRKYVDLKNKRK